MITLCYRQCLLNVGIAAAVTLSNMLKDPTHIQTHLVFADRQRQNKKPKELELCQRTDEIEKKKNE